MSGTAITCPSGHSNPEGQHFCGECGASLAGFCHNGHQNPASQKYCGTCGVRLRQSATVGQPSQQASDQGLHNEDLSGSSPLAPEPRVTSLTEEAISTSGNSGDPGMAVQEPEILLASKKSPTDVPPTPLAGSSGSPMNTTECPDGHSNPLGRATCRECGSPLVGAPKSSAPVGPKATSTSVPGRCSRGHDNPDWRTNCRECGEVLVAQAQPQNKQETSRVQVGARFRTKTGSDATVRAVTGNDVWVDVQEAGNHLGRFRFSVPTVEKALAEQTSRRQARLNQEAETTLQVGDKVALASGRDVPVVSFDDDTVWLNVSKGLGPYTVRPFRRRDVEKALAEGDALVEEQSESVSKEPLGTSDGGVSRPSRPGFRATRASGFWAGLGTWGKAALVGIPVLIVLTLVWGGSAGRDKESYDWGYNKGTMGWTQNWANYSQKEACQSILKLYFDLPGAKGIDHGDAMDGCMDAVKKRPQR